MPTSLLELAGCVFCLFLLFLPFLAIPAKRAVERRAIRWFDRARYKEPRDVASLVEENSGRRTVFFPVSTTLSFVIPACLLALSGTDLPLRLGTWNELGLTILVSNLLLGSIALCLILTALYFNYSGWGARKWKYDLVFAAIGLCGIQLLLVPLPSGLYDERVLFRLRLILDLIIVFPFFLAMQAITYRAIAVRLRRKQTAVRLFSFIQSPTAWLLSGLFCSPLFLFFLLARFHLLPRLAHYPILYFRSFASVKSGPAFREIIAPAARRYGIIEGLAHRTQRVTDLQGSIDLNQQAHLSVLPDDRWQDWVQERLRVASLVIIDTTGDTGGLSWEIETVLASVSHDRIAILYHESENDSFSEDILQLRYNLKGKEPQKAKAALEAWIKRWLLDTPDAASS